MELKNGETFNGHLIACDNFMNVTLKDAYETSAVSLCCSQLCLTDITMQQADRFTLSQDGEQFWKMEECYLRGNMVRYSSVLRR